MQESLNLYGDLIENLHRENAFLQNELDKLRARGADAPRVCCSSGMLPGPPRCCLHRIAIPDKFLQNTNCIPNLKTETNEEPSAKGLPKLKPGTLQFCYL